MSEIDLIVYGILLTFTLIGTTEFVIGLLLIREYDKLQEDRDKRTKHNDRNECINCRYYEKCGRPSRQVKCMGYEKGDDRDETTRETGRHVSSTDS